MQLLEMRGERTSEMMGLRNYVAKYKALAVLGQAPPSKPKGRFDTGQIRMISLAFARFLAEQKQLRRDVSTAERKLAEVLAELLER